MEESKYYVPAIEDLYIGYEYETKDIPPPKNDWKQDTITTSTNMEWMEKWIAKGEIRVPYLTHEDILSEGWEEDAQLTENTTRYKRDDIRLVHNKATHVIRIWEVNEYSDEKPLTQSLTASPIQYKGEGKSINEFRKIQQWLGIK